MRSTTETAAPADAGLLALAPLAARLAKADRIVQQERGAILTLRRWPWVVGFLFVCFAVDVVLHLGAWPRLGMSLVFAALALGGLAVCAWIAWVKRNSLEHIARVLESRHPRLGSKLINILQLRQQACDPAVAPLTRQLAAGAVESYAAELRNEPLEQLARSNAVAGYARGAGWWFLGFAVVAGGLHDITRTEFLRFADPFGDHPPYSFTRLEIGDPADDATVVPYGGSIPVTARVSGHRPGELFLTHHPVGRPDEAMTTPMFDKGDRGFTQQIQGIRADIVVFAHTKNQHSRSKLRRIGVVLTPKLEQAWVKIAPPVYTGLAGREQELQFKSLKALTGSVLNFRLRSNRPLGEGVIEFEKAPGEMERVRLAPTAEREVSGDFPATATGRLKFSIYDVDGNRSAETWELALTVTHDLPPEVTVKNPESDSFVAMDFKVEPMAEAADDYGVATLRFHLAHNGNYGEPRVTKFEKPTLNARDVRTLDLKTMGLQSGDTISYFAEAIDNAPEPHLARSKTVTLTVISTEEYNDFLRERTDLGDIEAKYSQLLNEFRDLVEQQKKLGEAIEALKQEMAKAPDDKARAAQERKMEQLLAKQAEINEKLNQLAQTMENFVREKPLYDIEAQIGEVLKEKAEQIRESTAENEKAREQIARESGAQKPPEGAQNSSDGKPQAPKGSAGASSQPQMTQKAMEDFKKASDEQLARLGETAEQIAEQVQQPLEDMSLMHEIMKDINRFKELFEAQQQVAEQSKAYDRPTPLNREDQLALKDLAAQEKAIGEELEAVEQKLWEDGKAAQEKFPKAGKSAQELAQMMGDLRLRMHANNATDAMTAGDGKKGAALSEKLRSEMEKMFSECNGKEPGMNDELDQQMSIQRSLNPKNSFRQMMQCKKFGDGQKEGKGRGFGGRGGFAVQMGPNANVLGNEQPITDSSQAKAGGNGNQKAPPVGATPEVALDKSDVVKGVNDANRESEAVQGEATVEQYRDIVEKYFRAITK